MGASSSNNPGKRGMWWIGPSSGKYNEGSYLLPAECRTI